MIEPETLVIDKIYIPRTSITVSEEDMIFVFSSNESGIHGAGAAAYARKHLGAVMGVGFGPTGKCFAIPTKDWEIHTLDLKYIQMYIRRFLNYAYTKKNKTFKITQIGCGLAGCDPFDIANCFITSPSNCYYDTAWKYYLGERVNYWGTYGGTDNDNQTKTKTN